MKIYCCFDTNENVYVGKPFIAPSDFEASMSFKADYDAIVKQGVNPSYLQLRKIGTFDNTIPSCPIDDTIIDVVALTFIEEEK